MEERFKQDRFLPLKELLKILGETLFHFQLKEIIETGLMLLNILLQLMVEEKVLLIGH